MRPAPWFALSLTALGCMPELDDDPYLVDGPRLIAVIAEPPEVRPHEPVTLTPVVVGGRAGALSFRFCSVARSPADPRPISERCFSTPGAPLEPIEGGARGVVPTDACVRFGPDPSGDARPADPDSTGGFYVPIVIEGLGEPSAMLLRIHCTLPDAPADVARELEQRYALNQNPPPDGLTLSDANGNDRPQLARGQTTTLRASWPASARESYVWLPADTATIEERREAVSLNWFTDAAALATFATGRGEDDDATFSTNAITPAPDADSVRIWLTLRDSRGGSLVGRWDLPVTP